MFNVLRSHQTAHHRVGVGLNLPWQVGLLVCDYLGPHHRLLLLLLLRTQSDPQQVRGDLLHAQVNPLPSLGRYSVGQQTIVLGTLVNILQNKT